MNGPLPAKLKLGRTLYILIIIEIFLSDHSGMASYGASCNDPGSNLVMRYFFFVKILLSDAYHMTNINCVQ